MSIFRSDPAAPGANVGRRRQPASVSPLVRGEEAVAAFNRSQAARTVAGLTRTLGGPRASIGAVAGSPSEVRVTVAWELCWYQWVVDLDGGAVWPLDRGGDPAQLDRSARQWNAGVAAGRLALAGGPVRRPARQRRAWLRRR